MKKLLALVLSLILVLGSTGIDVYADKPDKDACEEITANIDLTKGTQTIYTVDKDGNEAVVKATEIKKISPMKDVDYRNSTWLIEFDTLGSHIEYYIDIYVWSDGIAEILDTYDPYWYISIYNVDDSDLRIVREKETSTRSARAELYFEFSLIVIGGGSRNGYLRTDIKDMVLTVTSNI